jgi:hypothetical protein
MRLAMAVLIACLSVMSPEPGVCADFGPISISVPEGFDGPLGGAKDGAVTAAWVKHHTDSEGGTLLQVTTYDEGSNLRGTTREQQAANAKKYLLDFVRGVARRRDNFKLGPVEPLSLAGLAAARVEWTGSVGSVSGIGVMYCVLVGGTIVSFHTQDTGSEITTAMKSAMAAIEGVKTR